MYHSGSVAYSLNIISKTGLKIKKHRHLWLTRDDVTRGTTLFQSPYDSALFYVYSICYTNIQLSASARQMLFIGRLPYWNFQKVRVKCSQPVTLHLCFTTSSVLTYVHSPKSKILLHNFTALSMCEFRPSQDHLTISHCNYQIRNQKYLLQILLISLIHLLFLGYNIE